MITQMLLLWCVGLGKPCGRKRQEGEKRKTECLSPPSITPCLVADRLDIDARVVAHRETELAKLLNFLGPDANGIQEVEGLPIADLVKLDDRPFFVPSPDY